MAHKISQTTLSYTRQETAGCHVAVPARQTRQTDEANHILHEKYNDHEKKSGKKMEEIELDFLKGKLQYCTESETGRNCEANSHTGYCTSRFLFLDSGET